MPQRKEFALYPKLFRRREASRQQIYFVTAT
jgi:hypothetical protein